MPVPRLGVTYQLPVLRTSSLMTILGHAAPYEFGFPEPQFEEGGLLRRPRHPNPEAGQSGVCKTAVATKPPVAEFDNF